MEDKAMKVEGEKRNSTKRERWITVILCLAIIVVMSIIAMRVYEPMYIAPSAPIYMDDIGNPIQNLV